MTNSTRLPRALAIATVATLLLAAGAVAAHPSLVGLDARVSADGPGEDGPDRPDRPDRPDHPPRDAPGKDRHATHQRGPAHGPVALGLLVGSYADGNVTPAAGATVTIERFVPNENSTPPASGEHPDGTFELVEEGTVSEDGTYATALPAGPYRVTITDGEDTKVLKVRLHEDTWRRVVLGFDGPRTMDH